MKRTIWLLGSILIISLTFALLSAKPAAAENHITVTITDDIVANDGQCSLREAIVAANSNVASGFLPGECPAGSDTVTDVILLEPGEVYHLTLLRANEDWGATGDLDILNNPDVEVDVHVMVAGEGYAVISGNGLADRVWHVHPGAHLILERVDARGASTGFGAGLLNSNGHVTLMGAMFTLNKAALGGAIFNTGADAIVTGTDANIINNEATSLSGGGIVNLNGATLILTDTLIAGNEAAEHGGGLVNGENGMVTLTNVSFSGNSSGACGGGVSNWDGQIALVESHLKGNLAANYGGGLCNAAGTVEITDGTLIEQNESYYYGGGGIANSGVMLISHSIIQENKALDLDLGGGFGGGLYAVPGSETTIIRSAIRGNLAEYNGGGIAAEGQLTVEFSLFEDNHALNSGGGLANGPNDDPVMLTRTTFVGNEAIECGGAIANLGGEMTLVASELADGNSTQNYGGGLCNETGVVHVTQGTLIAQNESYYLGGGIGNNAVMVISDSVVDGNQAFDMGNDGGVGGGLFASPMSETTVIRSAILNNTADTDGGAIATLGQLSVYNSTLSNNQAAQRGSALFSYGPFSNVTLINATLAENIADASYAGLYLETGTVTVGNTIMADNLGENCFVASGDMVSLGHNLASDDSCSSYLTAETDLNDVDPLLGPQQNGVHHLQLGSPAIDAGDAALCADTPVANVDQLGQARPKFNGCDIGAVEWQGFDLYLPVIIR
jgi:CSLREA domain-containing protein